MFHVTSSLSVHIALSIQIQLDVSVKAKFPTPCAVYTLHKLLDKIRGPMKQIYKKIFWTFKYAKVTVHLTIPEDVTEKSQKQNCLKLNG